ncbi:MAG TPA: hypothetical protein VFI37_06585 [Gaiellaceae bacterium]|nr:hypothetical protein [Gaiellaceae bacterium]
MRGLLPVMLAAALLCLLGGCGGGGGNGDRDAVTAYLRHVNAVEMSMQAPLAAVTATNRSFSMDSAKLAKLQPKLDRSRRTLRTLRTRLTALEPPARARPLHAMLLRLVDREESLAAELAAVPVFLPRYRRALTPLAGATGRLRPALRAGAGASSEAAALDRYAAELGVVVDRLKPLEPPPLLAAALRTQVRTLTRVRAAAAALADGLRDPASRDLTVLVGRLDTALRSGGDVSAQKAQIAALRAYDRRAGSLGKLERQVEIERRRLERSLSS